MANWSRILGTNSRNADPLQFPVLTKISAPNLSATARVRSVEPPSSRCTLYAKPFCRGVSRAIRLSTAAIPSSSFKAGRRIETPGRVGFAISPQGISAGGLTGAAGIENGLIGGTAGDRAPMAHPAHGHSSAGCPILLSPSNNYRFLTADPTRIDLKTVRTESRETF